MPATRKQPLDFRKEEINYIMQRWRAADSCSLVGVGSVGKSNLLQHLADPEVQGYYLGEESIGQFKAIVIDPNMLGPLPASGPDQDQIRCWAGYELMMHRLFMAFYPMDILGPDDARHFYETYQTLQDGTNPLYAYMGLRYFEFGLEYFMRRGVRIVFMFDEFEEMMRQLPVKFFQTLRGLRDSNKKLLSYLTFTRSPLPSVAEQLSIPMLDIEPFIELFTDNTLYVGPYNERDARQMVSDLMKRNQKNYPDNVVNFLLFASGRYAGLLRACFHTLELIPGVETANPIDEQLLEQMASKVPVRIECRTTWTSLTPSQRYVLKAVARLTPYTTNSDTEQAVAQLVQKRLLRLDKAQNQLNIEPPVFRAYVATNPDVDLS
jgi:hypothetical protein